MMNPVINLVASGLVTSGLASASGWMAGFSRAATSGLVAAVWQGVLLSVVVSLGLRLLPKTPAAVRFAIWFGVFVVVAALPMVALWPHGAVAPVGKRAAWLTLDARWCLVVVGAWATVSLVRAMTLLLAVFRVRALWKRARPLEARVDDVLGRSPRRAQLCVSDEVDRPTVIGFFSPKILIPDWLVEKLTPAELEQVVLHEAGHLGRADDWINLLQKIALVVLPLNPALEWVERRLCFERELACDERVLKTTNAPKAYAACLTTLAEHRLRRTGLALALGVLGRESELGRRVGRILQRGESMRPLQGKLVLGGAMLGLLVASAGLEHCPQMVGFAPAGVVRTAAAEPIASRAVLRGYGYQAVVFHPNLFQNNESAPKLKVIHKARPAMIERASSSGVAREVGRRSMAPDPVAGASAVHTVSLRTGSPDRLAHMTDTLAAESEAADAQAQEATEPVVGWVVVASWQSVDGARVVSRMVVTTAAAPPSPTAKVALAQGTGDSASLPSFGSGSDQFHPYAAVPVRGGWLVFQL